MGEITSGDMVQLKSGGPVMTVEWVDRDGGAQCVWFDTGGKHQSQYFVLATLIKA